MNQLNDCTANFSSDDIEQNKVIAALGYVIFFIPLLAAKDSAFGKFHANQGLILLLCSIILSVIPFINLISWLATFALFLFGLLNTLNGKAMRLPVIGNFDLIK
jgi:uncharacterized membrane protein